VDLKQNALSVHNNIKYQSYLYSAFQNQQPRLLENALGIFATHCESIENFFEY